MKRVNGIGVQYSKVNQAWIVTWHETVLRVISDKAELADYLKDLGVPELAP